MYNFRSTSNFCWRYLTFYVSYCRQKTIYCKFPSESKKKEQFRNGAFLFAFSVFGITVEEDYLINFETNIIKVWLNYGHLRTTLIRARALVELWLIAILGVSTLVAWFLKTRGAKAYYLVYWFGLMSGSVGCLFDEYLKCLQRWLCAMFYIVILSARYMHILLKTACNHARALILDILSRDEIAHYLINIYTNLMELWWRFGLFVGWAFCNFGTILEAGKTGYDIYVIFRDKHTSY